MEIKINGEVSDKLSDVRIDKPLHDDHPKPIFSGELYGEESYFHELFDTEFTLEFNGDTYIGCALESPDSGRFTYFSKNA